MSDSDLLSIFRVEVGEYLESLNNALLQIEMIAEGDAAFQSMLTEMNRVAHSMKGAARAVGMSTIEAISHYMEEVFAAALKNRLKLTPDTCDTLYDGLDLIQNVMEGEETNDEVLTEVLNKFEQVIAESSRTDSQLVAVVPAVSTDALEEIQDDPPADTNKLAIAPGSSHRATKTMSPVLESQTLALRPVEETVRVTVSKLDRLMAEATELLVARMHAEERHRSLQELQRLHNRWQREWRNIRATYIRLVRRLQDEQEPITPELSVMIKFLETNQRYLGEVNRRLAQLVQVSAQDNMHLTTLSDQLQEDIDGMRLIPFDFIVGGFQRTIRDLARELNKQIQFEVNGASVEIDKTVLDTLKDPLMHLLRNAIDHGIETPDVRTSMGKSHTGLIRVDVEQRGGEMLITVSDDGRGIDLVRVRQTIVKQKLLSELETQILSDEEALFYIFHPGFTTSEQVTAVSGRGIGMDVVRDRVESLRGRVGVRSILGSGTTITLSVPFSLTRIRCILLSIGDQQFALPSSTVLRMQTTARTEIFTAEGQEMLVLNNQPIPCVTLGTILDIPTKGTLNDSAQLIIIEAANRIIAFEVDALMSDQELVLKSLGRELMQMRHISGAALLGSGDVVLVLNANDLVRAATGSALPRRKLSPTLEASAPQSRPCVLIVDDSITTRTLEKNILETAGFEVHVAIDGLEGWAMLNETPFDIIISDVEMPKMNGLELTNMIKQTRQFQHIPVVLLTSLAKPEQREAGLRAGADAYLVKSQFDQNELLQTIRSLL